MNEQKTTELDIPRQDDWLNDVIQQAKNIIAEFLKEAFVRYRKLGKLILGSGYKKGTWKDEHKQRFLNELGIEKDTFSRMVKLGTMTEAEFSHAVRKFPSLHAWANQKKLAKIEQRERQIIVLREAIKFLQPPQQKFDVIVVDPPWPIGEDYDPEHWRGTAPYPTMTIEEIKAIKLPCAENSIVWLWATNRFLHDAYHILDFWGFEAKTVLTWVKTKNFGVGVWLRGQTEQCILAVRGEANNLLELTNESTVLFANNAGHSEKPEEFYQFVNKLCLGWKLDYFGTKEREGWTTYGTLKPC